MRCQTTHQKQIERPALSPGALISFPAILCAMAVATVVLPAQERQATTPSNMHAAGEIEAKATYESVCASCHGLDARGGERGPDVVTRPEVVRKTDAELAEILNNGRTAAGMPAFSSFGPARLSALVAYLRILQGRGTGRSLPGDPSRGNVLFFGKARCAECHMVSGQGGFFAQDLTFYAARLDADEVRARILNPDKDLDPRRGLVKVILRNSTALSGVARNEDNFSLQLQTADGAFHLLNKSDIRTQTYAGRSAMPPDFASTLSAAELNDIVSYLLRVSVSENMRKTENNSRDRDDQ
jgi:cytochrome c oxidase cbb3-type subunit 3